MDVLMIDSMSGDLAGIKRAAQATLGCLGDQRPDQLEVKLQSLDQQLKESRELLAAKTAGKKGRRPVSSSMEILLLPRHEDTPIRGASVCCCLSLNSCCRLSLNRVCDRAGPLQYRAGPAGQ